MSNTSRKPAAAIPTKTSGNGFKESGEDSARSIDSNVGARKRNARKHGRRGGWDAMPPVVQAMRESARARREWQEALEQLADCPRAKEFMWQLADREVAHERRVSFQWILEEVRRRDFTTNDGGRFRMSNNKSPVLARFYLAERPAARRFVKLKESRFDEMEGEQ